LCASLIYIVVVFMNTLSYFAYLILPRRKDLERVINFLKYLILPTIKSIYS